MNEGKKEYKERGRRKEGRKEIKKEGKNKGKKDARNLMPPYPLQKAVSVQKQEMST